MNLNVYYFIIIAILITPLECYHHKKNKHHRRQSPQMIQNPLQMPQVPQMLEIPQETPQAPQQTLQDQQQIPHGFDSLYQPNSQFSIGYPMYDSQSSLKRQNGRLSNGNPHVQFAIPSDNVPVSPGHIPYNNGLYSGNNLMAPNNAAMLPDNGAIPPNNAAGFSNRESLPLENIEGVDQMDPSSFLSESSLMDESQSSLSDSIQNYPESPSFLPSNLNPNVVNVGSKRRKKNIEGNTDELLKFFEKGKKLLKLPTESSDSSGKDIVNHEKSSDRNDITDGNTTLVPLPKGIQLKSVTKRDDSIIYAATDVSSSTQTIITYDDNTELEDVDEMQQEKKFEHEKRADKGYLSLENTEDEDEMDDSSLLSESSLTSESQPSSSESSLTSESQLSSSESSLTSESQPSLSESSLMSESQPSLSDSIQNYPQSASFLPSNLKPNVVNVGSKRKKKNFEENTDELMKFFEKGKKLLELPTESSDSTGKDIVNHETSSDSNDITDDITTLIPLPRGIQLKTVSKSDDSIIHAALNISSSTQTIITYDNNTELENVVEMQLEKKIEDEKGADKGYEEVRIVETQRVKPLIKSKKSNVHVRKRKNYKNGRVFKRHRSKRSKIASDEIPRSKFLYNKMAYRILSAVKRKERVVDPTIVSNLTNRYIIPDFPKNKEMVTTGNTNEMKDDLMYNKKEINDFMRFFLKEMKKFRKSKKIKNNISEPLKRMKNFVFLPREAKKPKKHLPYPEHMNVVMNLNMTWDSKMKDPIAKSVKITEGDRTTIAGFENKAARFKEVIDYLETTTVSAPIKETQSERYFKIGLLLSAISCLFTFAVLIIPKLQQALRRYRAHSAIKPYKLYDDYLENEDKEAESKRLFSVENQDLEWQSENGEWLPEKE